MKFAGMEGACNDPDSAFGDTESASGDEDEEQPCGNTAWAEVMGKILQKQGPKDADHLSKSVILVKNKEKIYENKQERMEQRKRQKQLNKKRKWEEMNHVKPDPLEKDYERSLQKIATRGVVQLFNAVKKHQKELEDKLKTAKTEGKREKVMKSISKGEFLDMLKDGAEPKGKKEAAESDMVAQSEAKGWDVLRDDYMMGNKLKDWDQRSDED